MKITNLQPYGIETLGTESPVTNRATGKIEFTSKQTHFGWSWTVIDDLGNSCDYRTNREGEGLYSKDHQLTGNMQFSLSSKENTAKEHARIRAKLNRQYKNEH